jgi:hypothetical protein
MSPQDEEALAHTSTQSDPTPHSHQSLAEAVRPSVSVAEPMLGGLANGQTGEADRHHEYGQLAVRRSKTAYASKPVQRGTKSSDHIKSVLEVRATPVVPYRLDCWQTASHNNMLQYKLADVLIESRKGPR